MNPREHVLARPGMYIGSTEVGKVHSWILNESKTSMEKKEVDYIPGLFKIFDEILVNVLDHMVRLKQQNEDSNKKIKQVKEVKVPSSSPYKNQHQQRRHKKKKKRKEVETYGTQVQKTHGQPGTWN